MFVGKASGSCSDIARAARTLVTSLVPYSHRHLAKGAAVGTDRNRDRAREIVDKLMTGDAGAICGAAAGEVSCKVLGSVGEELASRYLEYRGYRIVDRNYRCPEGEADLVARDPDSGEVVLVEVKTRRSRADAVFPEEAVTPAKQRRYRKIACRYAADHARCPAIRFDVITVSLSSSCMGQIRHLRGAFDWEVDL